MDAGEAVNNWWASRLEMDWRVHLILGMDKKQRELGYTEEDLVSIQHIKPMFACPHCAGKHWSNETTMHSAPTRLWRASSTCKTCDKTVRWLIDPDLPVSKQTKDMHRPLGF